MTDSDIEAGPELERAFKALGDVENLEKDITRKARAELADPKFELRNPGPPTISGIDDPVGPEARQQTEELEELLKYKIQVNSLKQANIAIDRWLDFERLNNRAVPTIEATV